MMLTEAKRQSIADSSTGSFIRMVWLKKLVSLV